MTPASWSPLRGLDPAPAQARTWLAQELRGSAYQSPWLDSLTRWTSELVGKILRGASDVAGLSAAITVLIAVAVITVLVWVLPRIRREHVPAPEDGAVLNDLTITARHYRDLAGQALGQARYEDAVMDGFRAIAKDMSDRRVIDDLPGRTAREVSLALASPFPDQADRLVQAADLFDSVRYGHRHPSARQAEKIHDLDVELITTGPLLTASLAQKLPI